MTSAYPSVCDCRFCAGGSNVVVVNFGRITPEQTVLDILSRDNLEAIVVVVRCGGCWVTTWSSGIDSAGLSMAAVKLMSDAMAFIHGETSVSWSPVEKDPA